MSKSSALKTPGHTRGRSSSTTTAIQQRPPLLANRTMTSNNLSDLNNAPLSVLSGRPRRSSTSDSFERLVVDGALAANGNPYGRTSEFNRTIPTSTTLGFGSSAAPSAPTLHIPLTPAHPKDRFPRVSINGGGGNSGNYSRTRRVTASASAWADWLYSTVRYRTFNWSKNNNNNPSGLLGARASRSSADLSSESDTSSIMTLMRGGGNNSLSSPITMTPPRSLSPVHSNYSRNSFEERVRASTSIGILGREPDAVSTTTRAEWAPLPAGNHAQVRLRSPHTQTSHQTTLLYPFHLLPHYIISTLRSSLANLSFLFPPLGGPSTQLYSN
jgi:hypothetical protein